MTLSTLPPRADLLSSRLYQAALTYPQRWLFRINGILFLVTLSAIGCFAPLSDSLQSTWGTIAIMQVCIASVSITVHLKQQLDDWRSRLTPGFRFPHLFVATVLFVIFSLAVPALVEHPIGATSRGFPAAAIVLATICCWAVYDPLLAMLVVISGISFLCFAIPNDNGDLILNILAGYCLPIIAVGIAMMALLWTCLARLSGQFPQRQNSPLMAIDPETALSPGNGSMGPVTSFASEMLRRLSQFVGTLRFTHHSIAAPLSGTRRRILHRRQATSEGITPSLAGALSSLIVISIVVLIKLVGHTNKVTLESAAWTLSVCPLMVPLLCAGLVWPRRRAYLAQESLLPATRRECVQEIGIGLALDLAFLWLSSTIVALCGAFLLFPNQFMAARLQITAAILLSAASQPFIFGAIFLTMLIRNAWI
jgi:hypothetical protein